MFPGGVTSEKTQLSEWGLDSTQAPLGFLELKVMHSVIRVERFSPGICSYASVGRDK